MDDMWFWAGDNLEWNPFSDFHNSQLSAAKANGPVTNLHIQGTDYSIDFLQNTQLNCSSGRVRRIHQGFPDGPPTPVATPVAPTTYPAPFSSAWGDDDDDDDDEDDDEYYDEEDDEDEDDEEEDEDEEYEDQGSTSTSIPEPEPDEELDDAAPKHLICPLTQSLMHDPVTITTGNTYERSSIAKWFKKHSTDPLSNVKVTAKMLIPNIAVRQAIEQFREDYKKQQDESKKSSSSSSDKVVSGAKRKADEDDVGSSSSSRPSKI